MEPPTPDWRTFGQPATVPPGEPAATHARGGVGGALERVSRATLVTIGLAVAVGVAGIGLALASGPTGALDLVLAGAQDLDTTQLDAGGRSTTLAAAAPTSVGAPDRGADLVVDVAGAVARPGLVRLGPGSRVGDAIVAAGGYAPRADLASAAAALNLAAPLTDGSKVLVPELGTGTPAQTGPAGQGSAPRKVDLNRASGSDLESLPGIGPVTAGRIVEARQQAPFTSVDELRSRGLVGESTFGELRDLVSVGG